jgi:hypothetical protein
MNQKNLDYLKDGLKYLGFGEGLNNKLTEEVGKGSPEFRLNTVNEYGKDKVNYALDFRKSDQSDMYFFNRYTASFKAQGEGEEKNQTFYVRKNTGVTAKEAYNLLSGRAVNKDLLNAEGNPYNAWMQLDFNMKDDHGNHKIKMVHQAYGYDLEKELTKHPIKELTDPVSKERLMQSLERGNRHQVTFVNADREDKMFIEANPQFKTLNVYDANQKKVFMDLGKKDTKPTKESVVAEPEKKIEEKKDLKNEGEDADPSRLKRGASRKKIGA